MLLRAAACCRVLLCARLVKVGDGDSVRILRGDRDRCIVHDGERTAQTVRIPPAVVPIHFALLLEAPRVVIIISAREDDTVADNEIEIAVGIDIDAVITVIAVAVRERGAAGGAVRRGRLLLGPPRQRRLPAAVRDRARVPEYARR